MVSGVGGTLGTKLWLRGCRVWRFGALGRQSLGFADLRTSRQRRAEHVGLFRVVVSTFARVLLYRLHC